MSITVTEKKEVRVEREVISASVNIDSMRFKDVYIHTINRGLYSNAIIIRGMQQFNDLYDVICEIKNQLHKLGVEE